MPGPPPNPNARRRNARGKADEAGGFKVLPAQGRSDDEVPALPARADGDPWEPAVLDAWRGWWTSPMATQWVDDADLPLMLLEADHLHRALSGDLDRAREYRLVADKQGLHALARLRLRWVIGEASDAGTMDPGHAADVVPLRAVGDED